MVTVYIYIYIYIYIYAILYFHFVHIYKFQMDIYRIMHMLCIYTYDPIIQILQINVTVEYIYIYRHVLPVYRLEPVELMKSYTVRNLSFALTAAFASQHHH